MSENRNKVAAGALLVVAGGIIGAGLALLFAPQSGKRTRRDISRFAGKIKDKASDAVEEFGETVEEVVENLSDKASELMEHGRGIADSAKKEILKKIENGQAMLEKEKSRLSRFLG